MAGPLALIPAVASIVGKVIDRALPDKEAAARAKLEALALVQTEALKELEGAASIIKAEAQSDGVLARNWRPATMLVFVAIIANNFILAPYLQALGLPAVMLDLPDHIWTALNIGLGGYVVGRSGEKIMKTWVEK